MRPQPIPDDEPTDDAPPAAPRAELRVASGGRADDPAPTVEAGWLIAPASIVDEMIAAVRRAERAGLTDDAIAACLADIRPRLKIISGSDLFAVGRSGDIRHIERCLRGSRPDRAIAHIEQMSRWRPWVPVTAWSLIILGTLAWLVPSWL